MNTNTVLIILSASLGVVALALLIVVIVLAVKLSKAKKLTKAVAALGVDIKDSVIENNDRVLSLKKYYTNYEYFDKYADTSSSSSSSSETTLTTFYPIYVFMSYQIGGDSTYSAEYSGDYTGSVGSMNSYTNGEQYSVAQATQIYRQYSVDDFLEATGLNSYYSSSTDSISTDYVEFQYKYPITELPSAGLSTEDSIAYSYKYSTKNNVSKSSITKYYTDEGGSIRKIRFNIPYSLKNSSDDYINNAITTLRTNWRNAMFEHNTQKSSTSDSDDTE